MTTKVLHVTTSMSLGGTQVWIINLAKQAQNNDIHMDILTATDEVWPLAEEAEGYGCSIFRYAHRHNFWSLFRTMRQVNKTHGPYDVIHSHDEQYSGAVLFIAKIIGIPVRIAHSHTSSTSSELSFYRWVYSKAVAFLLPFFGTHFLAVSDQAGPDLFGGRWKKDARYKIVPCGRDFVSFKKGPSATSSLKSELGLPSDAKVIGHVGRFIKQKNHAFLIEIMAHVMRADPSVWLVLVGWGPLQKEVQDQITRQGISDRTILAGMRTDVNQLMLDCFDLFLFPSLHEGAGIVLLEAQAAGKMCLISENIPPEVDVVSPLIKRLSLKEGPECWAKEALTLLSKPAPLSQPQAYRLIEQSSFAITNSFAKLLPVYKGLA